MSASASGKARLCLWYDKDAEAAATFYAATFPDSYVRGGGGILVEMTLLGMECILLNGGPQYRHSPAFSFQISTEDQNETDRLWNAIVDSGGAEGQCGWCTDAWGLSWQITPVQLTRGLSHPDEAVRARVMAAMMPMRKIDIAAIATAVVG